MKRRHQIEQLRRYVKDAGGADKAIQRALSRYLDIIEGMLEEVGNGVGSDELEMEDAVAELHAMLHELRNAVPELVKTIIEQR
jgi:pheromone shutdown protein TraB